MLIVHKNSKGEPHCPVLFKVFNNNSHIVAVKNTGNVFSYEAIEELNIKTKNWKDLLTDEPFLRKDIIEIQDPKNHSKFNLNSFHHLKNGLKVDNDELERAKTDPRARLKHINVETKEALAELDRTYKVPELSQIGEQSTAKADKFNAAPFSTGRVAASFTSTAWERETVHEPAILEDDIVRYDRVKKKGYVRLVTNQGNLNLELHCDLVQKTCENFIKLCQRGYHNGTIFHRSIRHFMIQGGDPTGTGKGGESAWGPTPFADEFKVNLSHTGRGILSMANSGPNTNKSQFFITYRSCKHLDGKHTIFGRVVGGMETLSAMEAIGTDNQDKPIEDIIIQKALIFVDPFAEADEQLAKEREEEQKEAQAKEESLKAKKKSDPNELKAYSKGVGKFLNPAIKKAARKIESAESTSMEAKKKKTTNAVQFGNFNAW